MPKIRISKYELWNALSCAPDNDSIGKIVKTDNIKELEKTLNDTISKGFWVWIDTGEE